MRAKIWKLQRPLFYSGEAEVMAYTEGKKRLAMIPMSEEAIAELFDDELKIYVKAKVNKKTGMLEVDNFVEEQPW